MVTIESKSREELPREAHHTIREFQLTVRWITNPEARHWLDDQEWGNLILALALIGKIRFIESEFEKAGETLEAPDQDAFSEAHRVLTQHRTAPAAGWDLKLRDQFALTVRHRLESSLSWRQPKDLADYSAYLLERDTIEFFLIGCAAEDLPGEWRSTVERIDKKMRELLERSILPELIGSGSQDRLEKFRHPLLPESFWWRDLPW